MDVLKKAAIGEVDDSYSAYSFHNSSSSSLTFSTPPSLSTHHLTPPSLSTHNSHQAPPHTPQLTPHNEEDVDVKREDGDQDGGGERDKDDLSSSNDSYSNC